MQNGSKLKFQSLSEEQSNKIYTFSEVNQLYGNQFTTCAKGIYYPYNYFIKDVGWGCAWRAIQTLLSTEDISISFEDLYYKFSEKAELVGILKQSGKYDMEVIEQLSDKIWSPAEIECHWAQPFIASIICHHYRIPHALLLLNGPVKSYAPCSVFDATINFQKFLGLIKNSIDRNSIMIDDGYYALSIIGLNCKYEEKVQILFADPHIKSNRTYKQVGVYRKTFNLSGKGIVKQQSKSQQQESLYSVYDKLEFQTKSWMICMIQKP